MAQPAGGSSTSSLLQGLRRGNPEEQVDAVSALCLMLANQNAGLQQQLAESEQRSSRVRQQGRRRRMLTLGRLPPKERRLPG